MTSQERKALQEYINEVFQYEHDMSTTILARLLLLCELLVDKGILKAEDIENKLSDINVAMMLKDIEGE